MPAERARVETLGGSVEPLIQTAVTAGENEEELFMQVVTLLASPRPKGNSAALAHRAVERLRQGGAAVDVFSLNERNFRGCQGCLMCKTKRDRCVLEDDLTPVLESVRGADALVIATPVYWMDVTAQLKTFIDRTYSLLVPDYLTNPNPSRLGRGRKALFILVQGGPEPYPVFPRYQEVLRWLGFTETRLVHALAVRHPGDLEGRDDLFRAVDEGAGWLLAPRG